MGKKREATDIERFSACLMNRKHFKRWVENNQHFLFYIDNSKKFCEKYNHWFHDWWNEDLFNYHENSGLLAQHCNINFNTWWNPEKFNWTFTSHLICYNTKHFNKWWDPMKIQWYPNIQQDLHKHLYLKRKEWRFVIFMHKLQTQKGVSAI